ncbi:hypothetical protein GS913_21540 [Rhodococcus hoagii]|nr:hypothetical protein [Prescottella equi]
MDTQRGREPAHREIGETVLVEDRHRAVEDVAASQRTASSSASGRAAGCRAFGLFL